MLGTRTTQDRCSED